MSTTAARVAAGVLGIVFLWAAGSKLTAYTRWRRALERYGLSGWLQGIAGPLVPVVELSTAALLIVGSTRAGAVLVLVMLGVFSLVLSRARDRVGDRLPCGCFGGKGERDFGTLLTRNVVLALMALLVLRADRDVELLQGIALPRGPELIPAGLIVAGIVVGTALVLSIASPRFRGRDS